MHHEKAGLENTGKTLRVALEYALEHGITDIVVASATGYHAQALEELSRGKDLNIVVVTVAGTGRGADTACLVKADSSKGFFDIKIREILIKPKEF